MSFQEETMPKSEVALFCECVATDVGPRLSSDQAMLARRFASEILPDSPGVSRNLLDEFASSGIRDMIVAAQARCGDVLYDTRNYIELKSDDGATLAFYCDADRIVPVATFSKENLQFASENEIVDSLEAIMMATDDDGGYLMVAISWSADGGETTTENWNVNIAGNGADADVAGKLLRDTRFAKRLTFEAKRGNVIYSGHFNVAKKIPSLWRPCPVR